MGGVTDFGAGVTDAWTRIAGTFAEPQKERGKRIKFCLKCVRL